MGRGLTGRRGLTQMLSAQRGVKLKSKAKFIRLKRKAEISGQKVRLKHCQWYNGPRVLTLYLDLFLQLDFISTLKITG